MTVLLHTEAEVAALPDGSIVSWRRIADDPSSAALAFVRREGDEIWLSPGGWMPQPLSTIDNYPVALIQSNTARNSVTPVRARVSALKLAVKLEVARITEGFDANLMRLFDEAAAMETYLDDPSDTPTLF